MCRPAGWTILCLVDPEISAADLVPVEAFYRDRNRGRVGKFDKGEPPRPSGRPVRREKNFDQLAHFRKQGFQLASGGVKVQVANKNFVSDDAPPLGPVHTNMSQCGTPMAVTAELKCHAPLLTNRYK